MDVEDHHIYPVFNVKQGSGKDGKFTFPDMAKNPYGKAPMQPLNEFTVDHPGTLIGDRRPPASGRAVRHARPDPPGRASEQRRDTRAASRDSVRLFRSYAHYFDKRGPISWDMAMTATPANWRPQVKAGDVLRISTTYNTTPRVLV